MSKELPSFEGTGDVLFESEVNKNVHARTSESIAEQSEYVCNICGKDCKTPGGLGSHNKHIHEVDTTELLKNDVIKVLAEFDPNHQMIYSKDLDLWVSKATVKIPKGFVIHSIGNNTVTAKKPDEEHKRYNTLPMILVRKNKKEKED